MVISIIMVIIGVVCILALPIAQFPNIPGIINIQVYAVKQYKFPAILDKAVIGFGKAKLVHRIVFAIGGLSFGVLVPPDIMVTQAIMNR